MMKTIKSLVVLAFISTSLSTFAYDENCTSVDFRNQFPLKMRDQKSLAWCFAHASADNLQFIEKTTIRISAADIAINYGKSTSSKMINMFQNLEDRPHEYGLAKFASQMILKQGYCPEAYFPSDDWQRVGDRDQVTMVEILSAIQEISDLADLIQSHQIASSRDLPYFYQFKNIDRETFYNILSQNNKNKILDQIRIAACDSVRVPFKKDIDVDMKLNIGGMLKAMNKSLSAGKAFSVDVYSQIFKNIDDHKNHLTNLHTVMIYGRKYDMARGQCLYMVKNSYSESCHGYDPRLNCDKGYLWFPGSVLLKNMTSAVFFK